jgi:hypothetical protein
MLSWIFHPAVDDVSAAGISGYMISLIIYTANHNRHGSGFSAGIFQTKEKKWHLHRKRESWW